jgi:vacuolar protein sorting-associated protein 35
MSVDEIILQLLQIARKHFDAGGERMRFTFPALITSAIKLCRRYKNREHLVRILCSTCLFIHINISVPQETDWQAKVSNILKFVRQLTSILSTQIEAPTIALRLFLLSAQIADECGFEDLTYDFYVQAFSVYEDSISESRAQLQAITLIISTLAGAKVFGADNYDTLITKAALHGAKLLKKSHQAIAVGLASHLWWQEAQPPVDADGEVNAVEKEAKEAASPKEENGEGSAKAVCISAHLLCVRC